MKTITVGIITYNGPHRVNQCLKSIHKWNDIPNGYKVEIMLVDDGSTASYVGSTAWVSQHWNVPVVFHAENKGISASWNDICRWGNSNYIVMLNDDILVNKHWLTCGIYFLDNNDKIGTVGWQQTRILDEDIELILESEEPVEIKRDKFTSKLVEKMEYKQVPEMDMFSAGCCFLMKREVYEMTDGFDETYKSYYEESDLGVQLLSKILPSFRIPYCYLYHSWGKTFSENTEFLKPSIRMVKSRMYFKEKWGGDIPEIKVRLMERIEPMEVKWLDKNLEEQSGIMGWEE